MPITAPFYRILATASLICSRSVAVGRTGRQRLLAALPLTTLLLYGCISLPNATYEGTPDTAYLPEPVIGLPSIDSESLLAQGATRLDPAQALPALESSMRQQHWATAARIAQFTLPTDVLDQLGVDAYARFTVLAADAFTRENRYADTLRWLEHPLLLAQLPLMRLDDQLAVSRARAAALFASGHYAASARERIFIHDLLTGAEEKAANSEAIWAAVRQIPPTALEQHLQQASDRPFKGWLELGAVAQANDLDIGAQVARLDEWRQRWRGHAAASHLPTSLGVLRTMALDRPRTIGIMLPLSGSLAAAGRAVLDGVLSSYMQGLENGWQVPLLRVYDTGGNTLDALYQRARLEGCELLLGPLQKRHVEALMTMSTDIPIVALNYVTNGMPAPPNILQFGLAAEDEAAQLANEAIFDGYRNVLMLQASSNWAQRAAQSFTAQWQHAGLRIAAHRVLGDNQTFSDEIASALMLAESKQRHQRLQQLTGRKLEFTPRRRDDIDLVLLLANHQQAMSIKPLLAYHYAKELPVMASSQVFAGDTSGSGHRDLNGVIFNDIPWVLDTPPLKRNVANQYRQNKQLGRLFAMGADAFFIHARLKQLSHADAPALNGLTGRLRIVDNRLTRQLLMATIVNGKAQRIETHHR